MLISRAYPVECPEQIVSSFIWLERSRKRLNLMRIIFESPIKQTIKLSDIIGKGELGFGCRVDCVSNDKQRMPSKIKSGAQVVNNLGNGNSKTDRECIQNSYMQNFIRLRLTNEGVWFFVNEINDHLFEFVSAFISPRDGCKGIIEYDSH
jgi:hypothetical protein